MQKRKSAIGDGNTGLSEVLEAVMEHGVEGLAECFGLLLNQAMEVERSRALRAEPYQRTGARTGYANGYKPKTLRTRLGDVQVRVPQTRGVDFYPSALEKGIRSERALKATLAEMYIHGTSTRKVEHALKALCGLEVTSMEVSRATQALDAEFETWRARPLGRIRYLILDARYEKARDEHSVQDVAVLIAVGVDESGKRTVLGLSVEKNEAELHWRSFLESLLKRGLHGMELVVSDDHGGLRAARRALFPSTPWQRCQYHLMNNALDHIPKKSLKDAVVCALRDVFAAPSSEEAHRRLNVFAEDFRQDAPRLAAWAEENIPEGFAVFRVPERHRRKLRTTNGLERLNREIKRRTRVASIFPNRAAVIRLVTGILIETDENWQTGKTYLKPEAASAAAGPRSQEFKE